MKKIYLIAFIAFGLFSCGKQTENVQSINNPMYDWYHPNMTRKECTQYLLAQGDGAFIIRDSEGTPGWHMLGIKMNNEVIHEKIRYTEDCKYVILSSKTDKKQPQFNNLADLVQFYLQPQEDSPYCLAMSNPIYDNHLLTQNNTSYDMVTDINAPVLPLKDREIEHITTLVRNGVVNNESYNRNDIYTNTEEAKKALIERANINNNNEYLITGNDCDINNS